MSTSVGVKRNKLAAPSAPVKTTRRSRVSAAPSARDAALAHNALTRYQAAFHEWEAVVAYSPRTIEAQRHALRRFIAWADERGLSKPQDITRPILERYQRHVYHHRKANGQPLTVSAQLGLILPLQAWFKWLTKHNHILYNPAADLDLPTRPKALPKGLLSVAQVEDVLNGCDVGKPEGLRMRAMLEVLYSTGIRRFELAGVKLFDVDVERGALMVRQGKGSKDRLVPVGERACAWVDKYLREVRPDLATGADDYRLFLDDDGRGFTPERIGDWVRRQLTAAGIEHPGSCHLLRVACATHMLENGADIRFIQSLLGHAKLDTTQIYTLVSLAKLKEVHNATHPARLKRDKDGPADANTAPPGAQRTPAGTKGAADARATFLAALQREHDDDAGQDAQAGGETPGVAADALRRR